MTDPPLPIEVVAFVQVAIPSIWTLELLLFLTGRAPASFAEEELVRELRASPVLIADTLAGLKRAGLVEEELAGGFRYRPASAAAAALVEDLRRLSVERPVALRNAILAAPHQRVLVFANAFRIKKQD